MEDTSRAVRIRRGSCLRPDVGTQAQFKKRKPPATYRYDSSLAPALEWDGQNSGRELGEWLLRCVEDAARLDAPHLFATPREYKMGGDRKLVVAGLRDAVEQLKQLSSPFLNWAGKAERFSFDVPTLPLFVHERLSTKAILETLKGHKRDKQMTMFDLFGDPSLPIHQQVLRAYEHVGGWVNRLILGDSLVVMNSLLRYENLGGQVQMIYMDPPYGVKFGSNFQPFVRKRDVKHNDDEDMTREPEMVKAYRDTWELGLHSYLTYMRDRLLLARDLLTPSGSIFVQISDENVHHVRELMDEVFGADNVCSVVSFAKTTSATSELLPTTTDYLLWYARNRGCVKYRQLYLGKEVGREGARAYNRVELPNRERRSMTTEERNDLSVLPDGSRIYAVSDLTSQRPPGDFPVQVGDRVFRPRPGYWKTGPDGMRRLVDLGRVEVVGATIRYVRYFEDFPVYPLSSSWTDTGIAGFASDKLYVVQTNPKVIQRCMNMTTDPGDLVLDPTCGSGTSSFVAEQLGRRWITIDTSRVPLALARQRLLTATFPYYQLKDEKRGPAGGFVYLRKQNGKGEEVGGIVPHVTLKSIANDEPSDEEVLVDRPEVEKNITRVTGPFCVEATIPTPLDWDDAGNGASTSEAQENGRRFEEGLMEVLRKAPVLQVGGGKTVTFKSVRPPAKTLSLSAEGVVDGVDKPVALVFGPEDGAVAERLVYEAAKEAAAKSYAHLYVIGFAIQPNARKLVEECEAAVGIAATYVQATPDLMMGDLLKNMRSSQIFSVCGLPEVKLKKLAAKEKSTKDGPKYQVELVGLDVFDPITMKNDHRKGDDVPCWLLDTDYNGLCFHVSQAFFPRTAAWDDLKRALKAEFAESVWDHLAGTTSASFEAGEHSEVAVKVIDDRGNELMVVKPLKEAES
ncbi:MAG: site-specific DNA-methyltransferase [Planctomycetes bacterium]|nr:site-specific DNA-methyltransferase [Planctomycetota bacterium]